MLPAASTTLAGSAMFDRQAGLADVAAMLPFEHHQLEPRKHLFPALEGHLAQVWRC